MGLMKNEPVAFTGAAKLFIERRLLLSSSVAKGMDGIVECINYFCKSTEHTLLNSLSNRRYKRLENVISRRTFLLVSTTAVAAAIAPKPVRAQVLTDVETIVLEGELLSGTVDAAVTLRSLIRSNRRIVVPAGAILLHNSMERQRPPQFSQVQTCLVIDGVSNFHLIGNGATIRFGDVPTLAGHKWLVCQTSNVAKNEGRFCENISIRDFKIEGRTLPDTRPNGWLTALQLSSVKNVSVEDIRLTGKWSGTGRSSFMQGDNVSDGQIRRVSGNGAVTAFDISSWDNTIIEDFSFSCDPAMSETGFNLFYAPIAETVNLPGGGFSGGAPANVVLRNGDFSGYKTGIAIDGQLNTKIERVKITGGRSSKHSEVPKGIFVYNTVRAMEAGRRTEGVIIQDCIIANYVNTAGGIAAGVRIFEHGGIGPSNITITHNEINTDKLHRIQIVGKIVGVSEHDNFSESK
jgi:hypothetical protein